jgi:hypothetical protein
MGQKTNPTQSNDLSKWIVPILVALISACAALIASGKIPNPFKQTATPTAVEPTIEYVGEVLDANTLLPIDNAQVTLEIGGIPPIVYTDSTGKFVFKLPIKSPVSGRIRVDAPPYKRYVRNITISPDHPQIEEIHLTR